MLMVGMRSLERAISSTARSPRGVSMASDRRRCLGLRPRVRSRRSICATMAWTWAADSTLGIDNPSTPGWTAPSMSSASSAGSLFTRTSTSAPPRPATASESRTSLRALAFSWGGTEASRSRTISSAPRVYALSTKRGWLTGRISDERRARGSAMSDDAFLRERGDALVGVANAGEDLAIVLTDRRGRAAQRPGGAAEARDEGVHGHPAHLVIRSLHHDAALLHVRIVEELADVVHRR